MLPLLVLATLAFASDNWPQFRGPGSTGVVDDPALPDNWSTTENVAWKVEIPGIGWSSPIVWGDTIFLTSVVNTGATEAPKKGLYFGGERKASSDEHRWMVYAVDFKTGKILWEREVHKGVPPGPRHLKNSYASETPVTDGERVYAYFGNVGLYCFDMKGKLLWSKESKPARTRFGWGTAGSPVLYQGRIYIVNDNDEQSYIEALDKKTGQSIWHVERAEGTKGCCTFRRAMWAIRFVPCMRSSRAPRATLRWRRARPAMNRSRGIVPRMVRTIRRRSFTAITTTRCSTVVFSLATTRAPARKCMASSASIRPRARLRRRRGLRTASCSR